MPDPSMQRLAGKVAIVTGGTRGIGLAIAPAYLSEGARVVVVGRTEASVRADESAIGERGSWMGLTADEARIALGGWSGGLKLGQTVEKIFIAREDRPSGSDIVFE